MQNIPQTNQYLQKEITSIILFLLSIILIAAVVLFVVYPKYTEYQKQKELLFKLEDTIETKKINLQNLQASLQKRKEISEGRVLGISEKSSIDLKRIPTKFEVHSIIKKINTLIYKSESRLESFILGDFSKHHNLSTVYQIPIELRFRIAKDNLQSFLASIDTNPEQFFTIESMHSCNYIISNTPEEGETHPFENIKLDKENDVITSYTDALCVKPKYLQNKGYWNEEASLPSFTNITRQAGIGNTTKVPQDQYAIILDIMAYYNFDAPPVSVQEENIAP